MSDQLTFDVAPRHLARRGDPDTSHRAARALTKAGTHRRRLLEVFATGPHTSEEAAHLAGIDPWQASKRTSDLKNLGLIATTGGVRTGTNGRLQQVLSITATGREALA